MRETLQRSRSAFGRRRCLIASADRVLITSVVALFDGIGPLVGVTTSEADALSCLQRTPADLLICSDLLESGDGPSLVQQARALHPQLICLMLIQRPLRSTIEAATAAGCQGLCSRDLVGNGHLLKALQALDSDALYIDPVIAGVLRHSRLSPSGRPLRPGLTVREQDVLRDRLEGAAQHDAPPQERGLSIPRHLRESSFEYRDQCSQAVTHRQTSLGESDDSPGSAYRDGQNVHSF